MRFDRMAVVELDCMLWDRLNVGAAPRPTSVAPTPAPMAGGEEMADADGASGPAAPAQAAQPPAAPAQATQPLAAPAGAPSDGGQAATVPSGASAATTGAGPPAVAPAAAVPPAPVPASTVRPRGEVDDGRGQAARQRVGAVGAEHCDEARPDYLQILRDMEVEDPASATDD